jgi:hypothetical protein
MVRIACPRFVRPPRRSLRYQGEQHCALGPRRRPALSLTAGWLTVSPSSTTARTSALVATIQGSEVAAISSGAGRAAPTIGGAPAASAMPWVLKKRSPTESSGHFGIAAEPPCQRELRGDQADVDQAADRVMRVAMPRRALLAGRVEQHVVAQQTSRDREQAGALDQGGPLFRAARGVPAERLVQRRGSGSPAPWPTGCCSHGTPGAGSSGPAAPVAVAAGRTGRRNTPHPGQ